MKGSRVFFAGMLLIVAACRFSENEPDVFIVDNIGKVEELHAPWDGLDDSTVFHCFSDDEDFHFLYHVQDTTITLVDVFREESDVELEDRVEIFFCAEKEMNIYYCAEIDPLGRVLDYSSRYYRKMDYTWDFRTLELWGTLTPDGYVVGGSVAKSELEGLGINTDNFYMGIFRADFRNDGSVNWYSLVETDDDFPDFHKPEVLFRVRMK